MSSCWTRCGQSGCDPRCSVTLSSDSAPWHPSVAPQTARWRRPACGSLPWFRLGRSSTFRACIRAWPCPPCSLNFCCISAWLLLLRDPYIQPVTRRHASRNDASGHALWIVHYLRRASDIMREQRPDAHAEERAANVSVIGEKGRRGWCAAWSAVLYRCTRRALAILQTSGFELRSV